MKNLHVLPAALVLLALAAGAQDLKEVARQVEADHRDAVVTVRLVVSMSMMGNEDEQQVEVVGTVIEPTGLTVVSAGSIDPAGMLRSLFGGRMARMFGGGNISSKVKETLLIMDDGTEVEAEVVLKDADLDLAFILPVEATEEFTCIQLVERQEPVQLLEDVFVLQRLGRAEKRTPALSVGLVKAVVKGPRTFYVCSAEAMSGSLGCVTFDAAGTPLGIVVNPPTSAADVRAGGLGGLQSLMGGGIVRPTIDVLDIAEQAKKVAAEKQQTEDEDTEEEETTPDEPEGDEEPPAEPPADDDDL